MKFCRLMILFFLASLAFAVPGYSADSEFDSEKMMSELEKQLKLSQEKLNKLKPAIEDKSRELKKSMNEAVDKGAVELEELSKKLEAVSKDAEKKVQEFLNSEEMAKLKDYLSSIDEQAIREVKDQLIKELTAFLALTQDQVIKLKPVLEDSLADLSRMLDKLAKQGQQGWEEFKQEYERFTMELEEKLRGTLDPEQMKRLEEYNKEKKKKIEKTLYTV